MRNPPHKPRNARLRLMTELNPTTVIFTYQLTVRKRSFKAILRSQNSFFHTLIENLAWRGISIITAEHEDLHLKILLKSLHLNLFSVSTPLAPQTDYLIQVASRQEFLHQEIIVWAQISPVPQEMPGGLLAQKEAVITSAAPESIILDTGAHHKL